MGEVLEMRRRYSPEIERWYACDLLEESWIEETEDPTYAAVLATMTSAQQALVREAFLDGAVAAVALIQRRGIVEVVRQFRSIDG